MFIKAAVLPFPGERLIAEQVELAQPEKEIYWSGSFLVASVTRMRHNLSKGDHDVLYYPTYGFCSACINGRPYDCEHLGDFFDGLRLDGTSPMPRRGETVAVFFGHAVLQPIQCATREMR